MLFQKKITTSLIILSFSLFVKSQNNYKVSEIKEELLENANAIVRDNYTLIELNAIDEMIITEKRVITVLNRFGENLLDTYVHYDDSSKIMKISALILDDLIFFFSCDMPSATFVKRYIKWVPDVSG